MSVLYDGSMLCACVRKWVYAYVCVCLSYVSSLRRPHSPASSKIRLSVPVSASAVCVSSQIRCSNDFVDDRQLVMLKDKQRNDQSDAQSEPKD